jgi:hypothetical protein
MSDREGLPELLNERPRKISCKKAQTRTRCAGPNFPSAKHARGSSITSRTFGSYGYLSAMPEAFQRSTGQSLLFRRLPSAVRHPRRDLLLEWAA